MGELRLPGLGAGAARPVLGPWTGGGVGDLTELCRKFTDYPENVNAVKCRKYEETKSRKLLTRVRFEVNWDWME